MRRVFGRSALGWVGAGLFFTVGFVALFAPLLTPYMPQSLVGLPFQGPSTTHWLGTDDLGHDIFSQLIYGARLSLLIGLLSAFFAVAVGLAVALMASYFRGMIEMVLMRLVDITLAFPFLPLVIVLAAFLGRTIGVTILTITVVLWARPALILWTQASKVRQFQHVTAATAMGASPVYIMTRHMLPRLLPLATPLFVRTANVAIFLEAAMAFLGVGDPNRTSWGTMLYFANTSNVMLLDAWLWWILPVGLSLTATIVGLAYMGQAMEAWSDPRLTAAPNQMDLQVGSTDAVHQPMEALEPQRPDGSNSLLTVQDLTIWYDDPRRSAPAVNNINFSVDTGKIVGLVGDSGCGKSTVVMSILRLQQNSFYKVSGALRFQGRDLHALTQAEMIALRGHAIALVPQNAMNALNPVYTVLNQIVEAAQLLQGNSDAISDPTTRAHEVLDQVGIPAQQHAAFPHELSGGMRQRAVIGMAVVNRPSLLIADEPTTGLDVITQSEVLRLLLGLRDQLGMAILLISHDRPMVARVADSMILMDAGRVLSQGPSS